MSLSEFVLLLLRRFTQRAGDREIAFANALASHHHAADLECLCEHSPLCTR